MERKHMLTVSGESDDHQQKGVTVGRRSYLKATGAAFVAAGLTTSVANVETSGSHDSESGEYRVNGWYPSWGGWNGYHPSDIPFELLDFVSIADFTPQTDGTVEFTYLPIESSTLEEFREIDRDGTRVIMCIGGEASSQYFPDAVSTASRRQRFVETTLEYLREYNLDGVDLNWEFPLSDSASDDENEDRRQNFMALLELLRERFDEAGERDGKYYWLTAALSPQPWRAREHDTPRLGDLLDFVEVMTYHFAGDWSSVTEHDAPLFSDWDGSFYDTPPSSHVALQTWISEGIPSEKVNFGIPAFGTVFEGVSDGGTNGLGQSWSSLNGNPQYDEIVERYVNESAYDTFWDRTAQVPWSYSTSQETFVSHENTESVERKCEYVTEQQLHGVMFWQLMGDTADHALLRTAYDEK